MTVGELKDLLKELPEEYNSIEVGLYDSVGDIVIYVEDVEYTNHINILKQF